ncbi:MAG: hypothetical protein ACRCU1_02755, partial [Alsobacter sp.]
DAADRGAHGAADGGSRYGADAGAGNAFLGVRAGRECGDAEHCGGKTGKTRRSPSRWSFVAFNAFCAERFVQAVPQAKR